MSKILLSLPDKLLEKLDEHCEKYHYERSEFLRALLRSKLFTTNEKEQMKAPLKDAENFKQEFPKPSLPELKKVMQETEKKFSIHDFGPNGIGVCFKCPTPHKK